MQEPHEQRQQQLDASPKGSPSEGGSLAESSPSLQAPREHDPALADEEQESKSAIQDHIKRMQGLVGRSGEGGLPKKPFKGTPKAQRIKGEEDARNSEEKARLSKKKLALLKRPAAADTAKAPKAAKTPTAKAPKTAKTPMGAAKAPKVAATPKKVSLAFPGVEKREPLHYGQSVVYFSPGRYRVLVKRGDRVDWPFNHAAMGARAAWREVCKFLQKANPTL